MNGNLRKYFSSWVSFSYLSFGAAAVMLAGGFYMIAKAELVPISFNPGSAS
jgi:hypothetical protein